MGIKEKYTLKFILGFGIAFAIGYLIYWLLAVYKVYNIFALAAILIFLVLPFVKVIFTIPNELKILKAIWASDNPEEIEEIAAQLRERDRL